MTKFGLVNVTGYLTEGRQDRIISLNGPIIPFL